MTNFIKLSGEIGTIATRVEHGREKLTFSLTFEPEGVVEVIVPDRRTVRHVVMVEGRTIEVAGFLRSHDGGIFIECRAAATCKDSMTSQKSASIPGGTHEATVAATP